jgi:hypothetical protein
MSQLSEPPPADDENKFVALQLPAAAQLPSAPLTPVTVCMQVVSHVESRGRC